MLDLTLETIAKACGGTLIGDRAAQERRVTNVVIDSRLAKEGSLFVAIAGERTDGHDYIDTAFAQGAAGCFSEKKLVTTSPYILVSSSVEALQALAAYYRQTLALKVVGVTGSVGKTTAKEVIAAVLEQKFRVLKTPGNFNNELGLPLTILSIGAETEVAVLEMGMSQFGEMRLLTKIARPDLCVMTNIGDSHVENLGSREGILKAKCEIFEYMDVSAKSFLNGDDALLRTVRRQSAVYYGFGETNDIFCDNIKSRGLHGTDFTMHAGGEAFDVSLSIPGRHVLYAAMAATGVGLSFGMSVAEIQQGLCAASTIDGRVRIVEKGAITVIDDCYNAAPASMKAGIDLLCCAEGRTVALLGDMGELGPDEAALHHEVGEYAARAGVSLVLTIGTLSAQLADAVRAGGGTAVSFPDKAMFLAEKARYIRPGDTVLVKASHFMGFSELVDAL